MRTHTAAALLLAAAFAVAGCSSSAATAGSGADSSSAAEASTVPGSTAAGLPKAPAGGGGLCSVQVTGATQVSWKSPQDKGSLLVSYWLSANDLKLLSLASDEVYVLMNCQSSQGTVSLTTAVGTKAAQFPKAPGTYVIDVGGPTSGGTPGDLVAIVTFPDKSLWRVTDKGSFVITSFTTSHFAGTFTIPIGKRSADLSSIVANATVSGTFDLACTGSACS
jgi:hypothetical protein